MIRCHSKKSLITNKISREVMTQELLGHACHCMKSSLRGTDVEENGAILLTVPDCPCKSVELEWEYKGTKVWP